VRLAPRFTDQYRPRARLRYRLDEARLFPANSSPGGINHDIMTFSNLTAPNVRGGSVRKAEETRHRMPGFSVEFNPVAEPVPVFISSILQMARRRYYWSSPSRFVRIVWSLANNFQRQLEIFRILSLPAFSSLARADPEIPFKYLSTRYLYKGLSARQRAASFVHHFRFLESHLPNSVLHLQQPLEMTVFERREGDNLYAVRLDLAPHNSRYEGELRLGLLADEILIYSLQFSIVPGWIVQSKESDAVFVLCIQGSNGHYEEIRSATKAMHEVAPPALLMTALQGIAIAWGIRQMAGICAKSQYSYDFRDEGLSTQAYDDFFLALGATRTTDDYLTGPLPLPAKPLELIKNGHKSRTAKKRAFKLQISREVCLWMIGNTEAAATTTPLRTVEAEAEDRLAAS
jgi:uncharacterized protein